jgi:hypothetical protein
MEFKISTEEVLAMAKLEEEAGCDIEAGIHTGNHLRELMEFVLHQDNHEKFVEVLNEKWGNVMSQEDISELASNFQIQIQQRLADRIVHPRATKKSM